MSLFANERHAIVLQTHPRIGELIRKDTSLYIGSNNVASDVKVDPNKFTLWNKREKKQFKLLRNADKMCSDNLNKNKLTNLEELSFLMVLAFPKASRMGLACRSCFSSSP